MSSCRPHQRWVSDKSFFRLLIEVLHRKECDARSVPLLLFFHGRCHAIQHEEHDRPRPFTLSEVSEPFSHREIRHGERPKWASHQMLAVPELNASGQWLGDVNLTLLLWFAQNRFDRILSHARSPLTTRMFEFIDQLYSWHWFRGTHAFRRRSKSKCGRKFREIREQHSDQTQVSLWEVGYKPKSGE